MTYPVGFQFKFKKDVEPEYVPHLRSVGEHVVFTKALESVGEQITVNILSQGVSAA
jgi:hypothetical protein